MVLVSIQDWYNVLSFCTATTPLSMVPSRIFFMLAEFRSPRITKLL
jgi:hypothetical protein